MAADPYHRENLRGTLLDLAEQALRATGADALSLRALAREAGVSHTAPFRHFHDKQALLDALALDGFERLNRAVEGAAETSGTFAERFRAAAGAYIAFAVENPALLSLMYTVKHDAGASTELVEAGQGSMRAAVAVIAAAQADGTVADGDPERLALVAFATVHGIATLANGGLLDDVPVDEATDAATDLLVTAMSTRP